MSGFTSFVEPTANGAAANIDAGYERIGTGSTAQGTVLTAFSNAHVKGSWTELTTAAGISANVAGIQIILNATTGVVSTTRFQVDIGTGTPGAETVVISNIYVHPGAIASGPAIVEMPINFAANTRISARCQSTVASNAISIAIIGELRTANHPPLYNSCEVFSVAHANTGASATDVTLVTTENTGWITANASTARTYGAIVPVMATRNTGTGPETIQQVNLRLGTGGSGNTDATWIGSLAHAVQTANPTVCSFQSKPIRKSVASGTRVAVEFLGATAGANNIFTAQLFGFY